MSPEPLPSLPYQNAAPVVAAVIAAGGRGTRMGAAVAKQYLELDGRPILAHTLAAFQAVEEIGRILLVLPPADVEAGGGRRIFAEIGGRIPVTLVAGGAERQASVENGIRALADLGDEAVVLIHDGVRPFAFPGLIRRLIRGAVQWGACIPVMPVTETVKRVDARDVIVGSPARESLRLAQTPQAFRLGLFRQALQAAKTSGLRATDDAALVETAGGQVHCIEGSRFNLKVTTSEDLALASAILAAGLPSSGGLPGPE
ncbi:MAG TPA: 2-C-methyl-D-erythritol 4-phosphate cytidylyltransferase [Desulfobacteraceae bacterium]|nr:2-C-methyl-D-erythritol 4-phosphate cytidylyltransferase [Desulfobacteraceae bacterium]